MTAALQDQGLGEFGAICPSSPSTTGGWSRRGPNETQLFTPENQGDPQCSDTDGRDTSSPFSLDVPIFILVTVYITVEQFIVTRTLRLIVSSQPSYIGLTSLFPS